MDAEVNTLASLRAKLGYAAGPVLLYATGGFAWAWLDIDASAVTNWGGMRFTESASGSDVLTGWTIGGGVENKFWKYASARLDVSHYKFEDDFELKFQDGDISELEASVDTTVVRGGVTFHLN